jgi:CBS domain-containing protein
MPAQTAAQVVSGAREGFTNSFEAGALFDVVEGAAFQEYRFSQSALERRCGESVMKVQDVMTKDPKWCGPDTNLAAAVELMWKNDCGVLPVVDHGRLAGIITDRDICIALGTRNRPASELTVKEVATREVHTCSPGDGVQTAMATMKRGRVHRLPVVDQQGNLEGIVSLNDLELAAQRNYGDLTYEDVMDTVRAVGEHRGHETVEPEKLRFPKIPVAVA